jgi:hypothetical protein
LNPEAIDWAAAAREVAAALGPPAEAKELVFVVQIHESE